MKTKYFLGMMAGVWMLAACSNLDEPLQQDEVLTEQRVVVNAYVPDDANSRLTFEDQGTNGLKVSWKESGESFLVMTADKAEPVTFTQTEGSTFEAPSGFTFAEGTDYYAFYPKLDERYSEWNSDTEQFDLMVSATAIPFDFCNQTGQLDENMNLMYAKRSADGDFQFQHMLAVMKFTLKGILGKPVQSVSISFHNESIGYFSNGTVNVTGENPVFSTSESHYFVSIPAENLTADENGNYIVYAYLPPLAAGTEVSITAYSEDVDYYKIWHDNIIINSDGIKAGYYYTAARSMDADGAENVPLNYTAGTVEELKAWIDAVSTYNGVNLTLTDDINLTDADDLDGDGNNESNWSHLSISGTVDGAGHSITGIKINMGMDIQAAPFYIESTGVVKNLHLKNVGISGLYAGGIATDNYGIISGCSVSGSVQTIGEGFNAGGIVADNYGKVTGCYNIANVVGTNVNVGGIAGLNNATATITACYNTGALSATSSDESTYIGGVVGANDGTITACYWNCTGAEEGIGVDYNSQTTTKVDDTTVTWETAKEAMNKALPDDFGRTYQINTDEAIKDSEPLILGTGNSDYVPV